MILSELKALLDGLGIPNETVSFAPPTPDTYVVFTPLLDSFDLFGDNQPEVEVQSVRVSLFCKGNYTAVVRRLCRVLLVDDFTITDRRFVAHENDTDYNHYAIDVAKHYELEE